MSAAYVLARLPQLEESEARAAYEIAKLVSGNGTLYDLDPNNHKTGTRWLSSWDPQRDAGFITLKLDFVAGDFDQEDGLDKAFKVKRQTAYPSVVMHSGGGKGRAHIFIAVSNEAQRLHCEEEIRKAKGDVRSQVGIRPPGAPHREGQSRSTSAEGFTLQQILELLRDGTRPKKPAKQKADLHQLASMPVPKGERSHRLYFLGQEAKRQGWSYEGFRTLILNHPEGVGEKIATRSPKGQDKFLRDIWTGGTRGGNESPSLGMSDRWTSYVLNDPRVKASRLNLEPVVLMIAKLSRLKRGQPFHLSQRELADKLNRGPSSVGRCLRVLCDLGHLRRTNTAGGQFANVYALGNYRNWLTQPPEEERGCTERVCHFSELHSHDSLTGCNGLKRYYLILSPSEPLTVAEIARRASRKPTSVYAPLKRLEALGLIAKKGRGYVRIEDEAAHVEAAKLRGSLGRGERRKLIHALQREGWRLERQRRAEARINEAKRLKLKDQIKPDQASRTEEKPKPKPKQNQTGVRFKIEQAPPETEAKRK